MEPLDEFSPEKMNVLVIGDGEGVAEAIGRLLEAANYNPAVITESDRAIELAGSLDPAVIVCDVCMPRCSGFATTAALEQNPCTFEISVIFVCGCHQADINLSKLADAFLPKPFHRDELIRIVREALQQHRTGTETPTRSGIEAESGKTAFCFAC